MPLWTPTPEFRRATPAPFISIAGEDDVAPRPRHQRGRPILWVVFGLVIAAFLLSIGWWRAVSQDPAHEQGARVTSAPAREPRAMPIAHASPGDTSALARGIAAVRRGSLTEADTILSALARARPADAMPHLWLGQLAMQRSDASTALDELRAAVRLAPTNALAHRMLGEALLVGGSDESARRELTTSLLQDPLDVRTAGFLGCALARTGQPQASRRMLERAGQGPWMQCVAHPVRKSPMPPAR